jgi:hypothetical protein
MKLSIAGTIAFTLLIVSATPHVRAEAADPRLQFVTEYIRELSAQEDIRANSAKELEQASTTNDQLTSCIHGSTQFQLELHSDIAMLKGMQGMHLTAPLDTLLPSIIDVYNQKIALNQRLVDVCSTFIGGPRPGVDYDKMVAEMPQLRAFLESMDETLFKATPLVFAVLIDQREDSKHHVSHLLITKAERLELLHYLAAAFGQKLEEEKPNYVVSSALLLKEFLSKDYKCADEPWE